MYSFKLELFSLANNAIQSGDSDFQVLVRRDADLLMDSFRRAAADGKYSLLVHLPFMSSGATVKQYGECVKQRVKQVSDLEIKYMVHHKESTNSTVELVTFDGSWIQ